MGEHDAERRADHVEVDIEPIEAERIDDGRYRHRQDHQPAHLVRQAGGDPPAADGAQSAGEK